MTATATRPSNNTGVFEIPMGLEPRTCPDCGAEVYHIPNVAGGHEVVGADGEWHHLNCPEPPAHCKSAEETTEETQEQKPTLEPLPSHLRLFVRQICHHKHNGALVVGEGQKERTIPRLYDFVMAYVVEYVTADRAKSLEWLQKTYEYWKAKHG